ncbi:MAG: hypothetical protein QM661_14925 [Solimonas sp.]
MSSGYPTWAPENFCRLAEQAKAYAEEGGGRGLSIYKKISRIFSLLATDSNMASVWPALASIAEKKGLPKGNRGWERTFANAVVVSDNSLENFEKCAPQEQRRRLSAAAKKSRAAAEAMRDIFDVDCFRALYIAVPPMTDKGARLTVLLNGKSLTDLHVQGLSIGFHLSLADILEAYADQCERLPMPLTHAAKTTQPEVLGFVRRLSAAMREQFGQPLHSCVSSIAAALYPNSCLSEKEVAEACRIRANKSRKQKLTRRDNKGKKAFL